MSLPSFVRHRRRYGLVGVLLVVVVVGATLVWRQQSDGHNGPGSAAGPPHTVRLRMAEMAEAQLGYHSRPSNTYCNRFSAYWGSGAATCGPGERAEAWCSDFAAWVWRRIGVPFRYGTGRTEIGPGAVSFYRWGLAHHTWHPVGSGYGPEAGDVAVYGLDQHASAAAHVAVVVRMPKGARGPNVANGDGDRTGFSVVERGRDQYEVTSDGATYPLSGYVSPLAPVGDRGVLVG